MLAKQRHDFVFALRQLRIHAVHIDAVLVVVNGQPAGAEAAGAGDLLVLAHGLGVTQRHADAGQQFGSAKRLGDVVVRAQIQAQDLVHLVALGGQHDDRDIGGRGRALQAAADLHAVDAGQHNVQQYHRGTLMCANHQRVFACGSGNDAVAGGLQVE